MVLSSWFVNGKGAWERYESDWQVMAGHGRSYIDRLVDTWHVDNAGPVPRRLGTWPAAQTSVITGLIKSSCARKLVRFLLKPIEMASFQHHSAGPYNITYPIKSH